MQLRNIALLLVAGATGFLIARRYSVSAAPSGPNAASTVKPVVEKVLHQHQGEDTPMVHAFEAALEEERQHEEQLAKDVGVHA